MLLLWSFINLVQLFFKYSVFLNFWLKKVHICQKLPKQHLIMKQILVEHQNIIDIDMVQLEEMLPHIQDVLYNWNLFVNNDKTEYTRFYLADKTELNLNGKSIRKLQQEDWRGNKSLGSVLCSVADIKRRCNLGNVAFTNFNKCWLQGPKIPLRVKIRLYDALVASVMLYNSDSWSAPAINIEQLDIIHRRHLRRILNIYWPHGRISNVELYKRCKTTKLSERVNKRRWTMLGHVMRSDTNTPAFLSLTFAISNTYKSRAGRHQCNLFHTIIKDLKNRNFNLKNVDDLYELRNVAQDRNYWHSLF